MNMVKTTAAQALELASAFRRMSIEVGNHRFDKRPGITAGDRKKLEGEELALRMLSEQMITKAVGIVLDDIEDGVDALVATTTAGATAVKNLAKVRQILTIAGQAITLGSAVIAKNPKGIVDALKALAAEL